MKMIFTDGYFIVNEIINSPYRFIFGLSFFLFFGLRDFVKNPSNPKRAKEYLFFFSISALASVFAILHDFITFNISYEYFEIGKGLGRGAMFYPGVISVAFKGSYWVGLVIGALALIANNPSKKLQQLPYRTLYAQLVWPLVISMATALIAFLMSFYFYPSFTKGSENILVFPQHFEKVVFIHYGTYVGAVLGTLVLLYKIRKLRVLEKAGLNNRET